MKYILRAAFAILVLVASSSFVLAEDGVHKLVLQISDNDPQKMNTVLNVAANVSRHFNTLGEEVDIKIVAFNAGLHMLRPDTSPVKKRIKNYTLSMPNVKFQACDNTRMAMVKKSGKDVPIFDFAEVMVAPL